MVFCVHVCIGVCVHVCMCVADSFLFTSDVFDDDDEVEEVEEGSDEPDSPGFIMKWARGAKRKIRSSLGYSSGTKRYPPTNTGSVHFHLVHTHMHAQIYWTLPPYVPHTHTHTHTHTHLTCMLKGEGRRATGFHSSMACNM